MARFGGTPPDRMEYKEQNMGISKCGIIYHTGSNNKEKYNGSAQIPNHRHRGLPDTRSEQQVVKWGLTGNVSLLSYTSTHQDRAHLAHNLAYSPGNHATPMESE